MSRITTPKFKSVHLKNSISASGILVKALYDLRKTFEEGYCGRLISNKYEETGEFIFSLNYPIFQANQLEDQNLTISQKT